MLYNRGFCNCVCHTGSKQKKRRVASRHNRQNNAITNGKPSTKCVANNKVSGEFFYPTEKLSDTTYNDLLYMTFDRTDTENYSAELLPYDCEYVLINGEKFDAVKGSILVDGKAVEFNLLVEANKRSENTKMIAVDKSGNKHEVNQ